MDVPTRDEALRVLREVLLDSENVSAETRRKAALDVIGYQDKVVGREHQVTEEQLAVIGRVLLEIEEISKEDDRGKGALGTITGPGADKPLLPL